ALTGPRVPDPDVAILAPRREAAADGAEGHVDPSLEVLGEDMEALVVAPVPDVDLPPLTPRREEPAVRAERHDMPPNGRGAGTWTWAGEDHFSRRQVPDLHLLVGAHGGEVMATGVERHGIDEVRVRVESLVHFARPAVPDSDGPIPSHGGEAFPVGAERHAVDHGLVAEDDRIDPAEPPEGVPFPLTQALRAVAGQVQAQPPAA